jgi:hemerythrin superfamily protein
MATRKQPDAIQMLTADHREVEKLFDQYRRLAESEDADDTQKTELAQQICAMLQVHTTLEEELFYPAARDAIDEQDLLDEAEVEHASAKDLIAQIMGSTPEEPLYDARVQVLGEYVKHHVKEEEKELFPKVKKSGLDLAGLATEMSARKQSLMSELGLGQDSEAEA